ncbi:MAG: methyltransferase domain-containing protein [Candidatus Sungbacteria bacterium]|nr:methyltransferase domain-containing protein [bacterium]MDZ4260325.1 methyltransferase domain-containing protein [Candidatus Sungbacteria bacterium]
MTEGLHHAHPTLARYFHILGIGPKDIEGIRVLDVGAGALYFAQEAVYAYDAEIYSCEPDLEGAGIHYRRMADAQSMRGLWAKSKGSWNLALSRAYEGRAEALPHGDEIFGLVVSCYTLPGLLHNKAAMQKGLSELWRVTASGGRIIMAPMLFSRASMEERVRILEGLFRFRTLLPQDTEWQVTQYTDSDVITGKPINLLRLCVKKI